MKRTLHVALLLWNVLVFSIISSCWMGKGVEAFAPRARQPAARLIHHNNIPTTLRSARIPKISRQSRNVCLASSLSTKPAPSAAAWWYMTLLALQFGTQPILTKAFTPKTICRSTVVLAQEVVKFTTCTALLLLSGGWVPSLADWSVRTWWLVAGIPAGLYVIQNYCTLVAYQNLPPVTFNVLNQTKTLSAALCCYLVLKRPQSKLQIVSLLLLLLSALVIEKVIPLGKSPTVKEDKDTVDRKTEFVTGVVPVLMASFLSGLAGALTQKSLQTMGRNSYLFTMELSMASLLFLITSLVLNSPDGKLIAEQGFFHGWTIKTWIPVLTNALGGIVVGLVTKYAGSVKKGFALIFGLLLSGILQSRGEKVTREQVVGGILAAISLWMHSKFPYTTPVR